MRAALLFVLLAGGCGRADQRALLPLVEGKSWTYVVHAGFRLLVEPTRVTRRISVDGAEGWELVGPLGVTRLGWQGDRVVMTQSADAVLRPPLPILVPISKKPVVWHGRMMFRGETLPTSARITAEQVDLTMDGNKMSVRLCTVQMNTGDRSIELKTWFLPGTGIVQQEQRTGQVLDYQAQITTLSQASE